MNLNKLHNFFRIPTYIFSNFKGEISLQMILKLQVMLFLATIACNRGDTDSVKVCSARGSVAKAPIPFEEKHKSNLPVGTWNIS